MTPSLKQKLIPALTDQKSLAGKATAYVCQGFQCKMPTTDIDLMIGLRVSEEEETEGLDLTQHDERGYNL